ncbi:MAG TPA: hypothetical protein VMU04_24400 [Candidatus Acidoferrum sp.]|nr:hypothetical protein [Candidatus Acidoferrum sp.]
MTFLPIIDRELRVAGRKRSTFWLRIAAALVAIVIGAAIMLLARFGAFRTATLGSALFGILTWLALGAALSAGVFFTSDCLSEEKREGTLGFLFLTDLRGYDVAGGKLLATSLRGCFALLAIFPILATTLLMGGVTGLTFWERTLALVNALFCSLAAGLFVSAVSRDPQRALAGTVGLLLLWLAAGPLADGLLGMFRRGTPGAVFSNSSPLYVFSQVGAWGPKSFWRGLLVNQVIAWVLFSLACALVPRTWQERRTRATAFSSSKWRYAWRYGGARRRAALRRKLIDRNAVLWLASRERWQSLGVWVIAVLATGVLIAMLAAGAAAELWVAWNSLSWIFIWLLYLWLASQSCRFFLEARRSGLIELLMAAPVSVRDIVDGQWQALLRLFARPVILLMLMYSVAAVAAYANMGRVGGAPWGGLSTALLSAGVVLVTVPLNLAALCWFGMWTGMTCRSNNLGTLKTLALVQVVPGMAIFFAASMAFPLILLPLLFKGGLWSTTASSWMSTNWARWYPAITLGLSAVLSLSKDVAFIYWSRRKLYSSFRQQATRSLQPFRYVAVPAVPPPVPAPPVIQVQ